MKFEKIIIPPGWQDSFTKYPNGRTIFEALSHTITTVNEGIEEVNQKVNQQFLDIDQAANIIRNEITVSFNTLKLQLESEIDMLSDDIIEDFGLLESDVLNLIAGKANTADVYTKQQVDAQLAEKVNKAQEDWIIPTLTAGWTQADTINHPVRYMKDSLGFVHMKGKVTGGKIFSNIFILPSGYRPSSIIRVASLLSSVDAYPEGIVVMSSGSGDIFLDALTFRAEA